MASILTNGSAMTALQTLTATIRKLDETQTRISTGLRVGKAEDNAAYWSIATTMRSDNGALSTVKDALGLGSATIDVAYTGMNSAIESVTATAAAVSGAQQTQFMGPPGPTPSDVKALRIKLQPEELGEVEVTIRRAGLQTKVTITVGSRAAADAIAMDKGLLEERLGSLLAPGNGHAVTFSMDIRDTGQGQAQAQGQGQEGGARGFTEQALAGGQGSGRDGRPDRRHQTLNITGDETENEEREVRLTSGSGRIV